MRKFTLLTILAFVLVTALYKTGFAEGVVVWGTAGVPVCTASNNQEHIRMVPDGSDGAIIVWQDLRGMDPDIYAQRINGNGDRLWGEYGVAACTATYKQLNPVIVGDGYGGAIIAWEDYRGGGGNSNIYAVRISSTGETCSLWPQNGVALKITPANQITPDIASVGSDGAVIVWQEKYSDLSWEIYAQGRDMGGTEKWTVLVSSNMTNVDANPKIINDGQGYVIITWEEIRGNPNIYAQRIGIKGGAISWVDRGEPVTMSPNYPKRPEIVPDGMGGAIIVWTDYRNGNKDIYTQRIDSNGQPVWEPNGIPICNNTAEQMNPVIINDLISGTTTGAIIAWEDKRYVTKVGIDIYAVKVGTDSLSFRPGDEKLMAGWFTDEVSPRMVSNNRGGGIIAWIEKDSMDSYKIFASKRNQDGDPVWINPRVQVCQPSNIVDHRMVSDGSDGVIIAWQAGPSTDYNIYAQRVVETTTTVPSASISGIVLKFTDGRGITGVEVEALKDNKLVSSDISFNGFYELTGLEFGTSYEVRATWSANDIVTSVSLMSKAPNERLWFILEVDYNLGEVQGTVSGVENKYITSLSSLKSRRMSGSGLQKMLSWGNGIAFVELEQRGKVIARVPLEADGSYSIPNLLPGRFIARAYNGSIYSESRMVNLKEGEILRVNFAFGIMPEETVFNYPNPAKDGSTTIRYYCGYSDPEAEIKIYNINGELVREVKDNEIDKTRASENIYSFLWDYKNSSGKDVASGVYIYIVEVKEKSSGETKKVVKRMAIIR